MSFHLIFHHINIASMQEFQLKGNNTLHNLIKDLG